MTIPQKWNKVLPLKFKSQFEIMAESILANKENPTREECESCLTAYSLSDSHLKADFKQIRQILKTLN